MSKLRIWITLLVVLSFSTATKAQAYNPLLPPNTYSSEENPNYWKNKLPYPGYWQQDVHYRIDADIDEVLELIDARQRLTYWNHSPDTLWEVYFHLYQNAFQPGSYCENLHINNQKPPQFGIYESQGLGTVIDAVAHRGDTLTPNIDNTVMHLALRNPILPGDSTSFDIAFVTHFDQGSMRRRMKKFEHHGQKHFDGVHWYPRIAVYDKKFGWTTDQHLGKEFYGNYGCFDVSLTFANHFIVEATGNMVNRKEMLPDSLMDKLNIENFKDKPWGEAPSEVIQPDSNARKTWQFHAENVHDFAFTADPTYRIGKATWNGITCYSLAQEQHASRWQGAAQFSAQVIELFSKDFGQYQYHKMIVADARDGMEYPMLTLDRGQDTSNRYLLAHEIGHNWFYGQVGSNETYRAFLDEGFTQFLTAWALENIDGDTILKKVEKSWYRRQFSYPPKVRNRVAYQRYLYDAMTHEDPPLNTHSDGFHGALGHGGGYNHVYGKTATMLYNLQYVLGDSLFSKAMKSYFNRWKMAHPYPEDFRQAMIDYTRVDLNWFFDQWLETNKYIDYKLGPIKKHKSDSTYHIRLDRKGSMQMPIDLRVTDKAGQVHDFHIPNTWFTKSTQARVLPKWTGWDKIHPSYQAKVKIPAGIKHVEIDPSHRLADVNQLNNQSQCPVQWSLDHQLHTPLDPGQYDLYARPEVWYNAFDGVKLGVHLNGDYMRKQHVLEVTAWMSTGWGQQEDFLKETWNNRFDDDYQTFQYRLYYQTVTPNFIRHSGISLGARSLDGLDRYDVSFYVKSSNKKTTASWRLSAMQRTDSADLVYLLTPQEWRVNRWNSFFQFDLKHRYKTPHINGSLSSSMRTSGLASDFSYAYLNLTALHAFHIGSTRLRTRFFMQYGSGSDWAPESELYLSGANPEQLTGNKLTRSVAVFRPPWTSFGADIQNVQAMGGGLNLRGYSGYLAPEVVDGQTRLSYKGQTGWACNIEWDLIRPINLADIGLKMYAFADAGMINVNPSNEQLTLSDLRADAGIGSLWTLKPWSIFEKASALTIRIDAPLLLNRVPNTSSDDYLALRWLIGVGASF